MRPIACAMNRLGGVFWLNNDAMADLGRRYAAVTEAVWSVRGSVCLLASRGVARLRHVWSFLELPGAPPSSPHLGSLCEPSLAHAFGPPQLQMQPEQ